MVITEDATTKVAAGETPRCPKCSYILLGLTEYRCPECGTPFDSDYVEDAAFRAHLLPWERPETGGRVKRLVRTLVLALLHPGRYFTKIGQRKDRRIAHAGKLIAACVLTSICLYVGAFLLNQTTFLVRLLLGRGQPSRALETMLRALGVTWTVELQLPLSSLLLMSLAVVVISVLMSLLFRGRLDSLRTLDLVAAFSPAVAIGSLIAAFGSVVVTFSLMANIDYLNATVVVMGASLYAPPVVLLLLAWFGCRKMLLLSRWKSIEVLVLGGAVVYFSDDVVFWLLY